jgi:hypothetical protein
MTENCPIIWRTAMIEMTELEALALCILFALSMAITFFDPLGWQKRKWWE